MKWWGLIAVLTIIFWFPSFFYSFAQDDFIHLSAGKFNSLGEILNFFNPFYQFPDIFFYRPLSTQFHFSLIGNLFGENALIFHIFSMFFHMLNGILFYLIILKIWKNKKIAIISALFYSISAIHFLSLFYISSFQEIYKTFYLLLGIFLYLKYKENFERKYLIGALVSYMSALLSKETGIVLPLVLPLVELLRRHGENIAQVCKENIKPLIPFVIISLVYVVIRFAGFQTIFMKGEYSYSFSLFNILQNLKWYILWSFGLPEILSTYPSLKPASLIQFTKDFPTGIIILFLFFTTLVVLLLCTKSTQLRKNGTKRILIISALIFLISLLPILFLHQHKYPQYLDLAFLGFLPIISWILVKGFEKWKVLGVAGVLSFAALQYFSINLSEQTHWTTKRSKIAYYYHQKFLKEYPNIENSKIILVGGKQQTKEVGYALAGKYAFQIWYPGKIREVQYLEEKDLPKERSNIIIKYLDFY